MYFKKIPYLHTITHNDKAKTGFLKCLQMSIFFLTKILYLHNYSDPLLSTLLKHLWQRLQPWVFLGMRLQAWHICVWGVSPILLCRSSQADGEGHCTTIIRSLQRYSIGFNSGLWLGHSRTFRDLSPNYSCVVLAVCLGSFCCRKVNLHPSLRSWTL